MRSCTALHQGRKGSGNRTLLQGPAGGAADRKAKLSWSASDSSWNSLNAAYARPPHHLGLKAVEMPSPLRSAVFMHLTSCSPIIVD
jgi:hypothetical protein